MNTPLLRLLLEDLVDAALIAAEIPTQLHSRNLIRAFFATVEGCLFMMKDDCLRHPQLYTYEELTMLKEESYYLNSRGIAKSRPLFLPLLENFRFTVGCFVKRAGMPVNCDFGGVGWEAMRSTLEVRHRITHPKTNMAITDDELRTTKIACEWFMISLKRILRDCNGVFEKWNAELREQIMRDVHVADGPSSPAGAWLSRRKQPPEYQI